MEKILIKILKENAWLEVETIVSENDYFDLNEKELNENYDAFIQKRENFYKLNFDSNSFEVEIEKEDFETLREYFRIEYFETDFRYNEEEENGVYIFTGLYFIKS